MKWRACLVSIVVLVGVLVWGATSSPSPAQTAATPAPARATPPPARTSDVVSRDADVAPAVVRSPDWGWPWLTGASSPFAWQRFDAEYYPQDHRIYFMGGRPADGSTDGSVWYLDLGSGNYWDTMLDLITPVSNYTMNLVEDETGMAFYVFCGREADGTQSSSVQSYYPDFNMSVEFGPLDDYPGSGTCTSGLNVVYHNKVYIAGGLDPSVSPYSWGETWVYDPRAEYGNRWTQLASANLSVPRAYMMSAGVDDVLYAIGGSVYDGTLTNQTLVEKLDLSDPTPVWEPVAPLPEPCSEGRAFGFDSTSQYVDSDGTTLAGKIVVTCGYWADENERVYVYDTRLDHWTRFRDLNNDRRSLAAAFFPIGDAGMLGVWGGRKDDDSNILDVPEYYILGRPACDVLLVDDDWDFTSELGGRPYYTTTLDALGYRYDVWDTDTQGTPSVADMAPYSVTLWFTGYDWMHPISPTEESEIIGYLNQGGNLVLSSQELYYAYPDSSFISDYLWVDTSTIVEDVAITETMGSPGDPYFAGLGEYTLARPDDWEIYWSTGDYEGPYNDEVHVRAGGYEPMAYSEGYLTPNSTRYDSGVFKTAYFAYPLEWLDFPDERAEVIGTTLRWMCPIPKPVYMPLQLFNSE